MRNFVPLLVSSVGLSVSIALAILVSQPALAADKWGLIRTDGLPVTDFRYDYVQHLGLDSFLFEKVDGGQRSWFVINGDEQLRRLEPPPGCSIESRNPPALPRSHDQAEALLIVFDNSSKKYGFMSDQGTVILAPQFDYLGMYSDDHVLAEKDNQLLILDSNCQITGRVSGVKVASCPSLGMAIVKGPSGFGAVDYQGRVIAEPVYSNVYPDSPGRVCVEREVLGADGSKKVVSKILDFYGNEAQTTKAFKALAARDSRGNNKYEIVDDHGRVVQPPIYDLLWDCALGFFAYKGDRVYLMDHQGKINLEMPPEVNAVQVTADRYLAVATGGEPTACRGECAKKNSQWGFMDIRGNYVIKPRFRFVRNFEGDLAAACLLDSKGWEIGGIINRQGFFVVPPKYRFVFIGTKHAAASVGSRDFNSADWLADKKGIGERAAEDDLTRLFRDYKIIGMSSRQLKILLGPPDSSKTNMLHYQFGSSFCGNGVPGISFELDKIGKILRWSKTLGGEIEHWNSINKYD